MSVVIVGDSAGLAGGLGTALDVPYLGLGADALERAETADRRASGRLVWLHTVPAAVAGGAGRDNVLAEAALLVRSAEAAQAVAERSGTPLVFVALLPSRGLLTGAHGNGCDLAAAAMASLMRTGIGSWSNRGHRLVSVVYAGLEGPAPASRRPDEDLRARTPAHALCTYSQLADAVRYVGSPRASYVTGTSLRVDGGWNAYSWMFPARTI